MRVVLLPAMLATIFLLAGHAGGAFADQVYHSERLDFSLTAAGGASGHPALRSGQVINIHPNGPVNGALERYMIVGANPDTTYDVVLGAFSGGCGGAPLITLTTTSLETDGRGNAHGQASFTAEDLAPLSGATLGVQWSLRAGGVDAYETTCTTVVVD